MNFSIESEIKNGRFNKLVFKMLAWFLLIISSVFILSWVTKNSFLLNKANSWPTVSILTAINFVLLSLTLFVLRIRQSSGKKFLFLMRFESIFLFLIVCSSTYVIIRDLAGWDFILEGYFWPDHQMELLNRIQKMSFSTALCFNFAAALIVLEMKQSRFKFIKVILSSTALLLTGMVLVSYAYRNSVIYDFIFFRDMSLPTAAVFFIFNLFWLFSQIADTIPQRIQRQDRPLYAGFAIIFILFALLGFSSSRGLLGLVESHKYQAEIHDKIKNLQYLLVDLLAAESAGRGFGLTGDQSYLNPFEKISTGQNPNLEELLQDESLSPVYKEKIKLIEILAEKKREELSQLIDTRNKKGLKATSEFVSLNAGKDYMDQLRENVIWLTRNEIDLSKKQNKLNENKASYTLITLIWGTMLAGFLLVACFVFYRKSDLRRIEAESRIQNLNQVLELKLKETELLNKEMESFSYSVSHDLRTPLRAMAGFGQILMEDLSAKLSNSEADYLKRIISASDKMSHLIDGLLVLSRLSRAQPKKQSLDIHTLSVQLTNDFARLEGPREVVYQFETGTQVWADEVLFQLLIQNLIGNAWKFTSKKQKPRIEVGSFRKGMQSVYYVKDNGAGFEMKFIDKLFGTFQRLHFEDEFQGTGIGLATSRRIVQMHGGEIWAEGKKDEGATFYFYLSGQT